jgi:hypothetical protein
MILGSLGALLGELITVLFKMNEALKTSATSRNAVSRERAAPAE